MYFIRILKVLVRVQVEHRSIVILSTQDSLFFGYITVVCAATVPFKLTNQNFLSRQIKVIHKWSVG